MTIDRAIEILDPEHREHYDSTTKRKVYCSFDCQRTFCDRRAAQRYRDRKAAERAAVSNGG